MATNSYIPASDSGTRDWLVNFAALLTADPTAYGETAGVAVSVQAATDDYVAAYTLATDPVTRTSGTIADKDATKTLAEAIARPVAMRINARATVTDEQRSDLGLTIRKTVPTPVPAPTVAPALSLVFATPGVHRLNYYSTATPDSKRKPFGAIGVELWQSVGTVAAVSPDQTSYRATLTKSPARITHDPADSGKIATYYARFVTRGGPGGVAQVGPWSAQLVAVIV